MTEVAERYRRVAGRFTEVAGQVPPGAWENPAPCAGWVARDVVRHLVEWFPPFLSAGAGLELPPGPPVEADPAGAWTAMSDAVQAILDDPATAARPFSHPMAGDHALEAAIGMFLLGDVLVHTWDLARAAGVDESIDAAEAAGMLAGLEQMEEILRGSGQFGPRVEAPAGADVATRLIAFTGRTP